MANPLPKIAIDNNLSFHAVLGIYGALQSVCPQERKTILNSYELLKDAYINQSVFVSVNKNNQPDGILFWKENIQELERALGCGIKENIYTQGLIVYEVISPFHSSDSLLQSWKEQLQVNDCPCWWLANDRTTLTAI